MKISKKLFLLIPLLVGFSFPILAIDILVQKNIALDAASDVAKYSLEKCRKDGYQVSVVIMDKHGNVRVAIRDDLAARQTLEIAERKANMVIMSGISSGDFRNAREDIRPELNHINGLIVMQGGLPIRAGGTLIGAVGISGAPGGALDDACGQYAIDKISERLEFADD